MLFQRGLMLPVGMEQLVVRSAVRQRDFDTLVGYKVVLVAILKNVVNMVLEKYFYLVQSAIRRRPGSDIRSTTGFWRCAR